jgi:hypothetical protein
MTEIAKSMIFSLIMDTMPSPAQCVDFGIDTEAHYLALRSIVLSDKMEPGQASVKLSLACGDGPALNALVAQYAPQFQHVHFKTAWDNITEYDDDDFTLPDPPEK